MKVGPEISGRSDANATDGLVTHLRQLGASILGHAAMRFELLSIEVLEEKARLVKLAISVAFVALLLIASVVLTAMAILAVYWDTVHRVPAAVSIAGAFGLLTVVCGLYVRVQLRQSTALFVTSAAELRLDSLALDPGRMPT
jgi:uncharacterized membrane protein YqjE